jgi:hypothetical protein
VFQITLADLHFHKRLSIRDLRYDVNMIQLSNSILLIQFRIILHDTLAFWLKDALYYEQPQVQYRYFAIVQLSGTK